MVKHALLPCLFLICLGCAGPSFVSRPVHSDADWMVRLDSHADKAAPPRYDHPAEWTEAGLRETLSRVRMQESVGLLERTPPPLPLFTEDDVQQLAPRLQQAFGMARPSEWIVFCVTHTGGAGQAVTSGGFFVENKRLHVLVANYHAPVSEQTGGIEAVRKNPMSGLKGTGNTVTFDPTRFVLAVQTNWLGGYSGAEASELILDHAAFLASLPPPEPASVTAPIATQPKTLATQSLPPAGDTVIAVLQAQVRKLQEDNERLKRKLAEQYDELAALKAKFPKAKPKASKKKPAPKLPTP